MDTKDKEPTITVRLVNDTKTLRCWFEEKLSNGQWVKMPTTDMACEGNSRFELEQEIKRRREERLAIYQKKGKEETFSLK